MLGVRVLLGDVVAFEDVDESGPVYLRDLVGVEEAPRALEIDDTFAVGVVVGRLVEYEEVGFTPKGIW